MRIRDKFFILKGLNYPFLLGMEFILKNNVILNTKNQTKTIDGMEYELDMSKRTLAKYDEHLIEKTLIYQTAAEDQNLKNLISEYKSRNPHIGNIINVKHEIQLS
ncbi:hypothetical protein DMUE_5192, partial [Dictyocoela muelleri]